MTVDLLIAIAALVGALVVLAVPSSVLVSVLVASTFVTRFRLHLLGHHFLVEHVVVFVTVPSLLLRGWADRLLYAATRPGSVLLFAYIAWGILASVLFAPHPAASLSIAVWLIFSWLIFVVVAAWFESSYGLERVGTRWAAWAAVIAVVFWGLHLVAGVQYGTATINSLPSTAGGASSSGIAAYGLSFEPNLLGSTMAIWVFLTLTRAGPLKGDSARLIVIVAGSIALLVSVSRAPLFGLVLGLAIWGGLATRWARRRIITLFSVVVVGVALIAAVSPQTITPLVAKLANSTNIESGSGGARYTKAQEAVADLSGHWVEGLGLDSFSQRHLEPTQVDQAAYLPTLPLQIVYDTGVIGVCLIVAALGALRPLDRRSRLRRARACGLLCVYGVSSLATSPFWFGSSWVLIAIAVLSVPRGEAAAVRARVVNLSTRFRAA